MRKIYIKCSDTYIVICIFYIWTHLSEAQAFNHAVILVLFVYTKDFQRIS